MDSWFGLQLLAVLAVIFFLPIWVRWWGCFPCECPEPESEATRRAAALLNDVLTPRERDQLDRTGYLSLASPTIAGRVYRIPAGRGLVEVYERNELAMKLCIEPMEPLPAADLVVMHKLMIQGAEREYLRTANVQFARHRR